MASRSKQKGDRAEYKVRDRFIDMGLQSRRVPLSGAMGGELSGDVNVDGLLDRQLVAEVKSRKPANVFWKTVQKYLSGNDFLFLFEDRTEPLIVMEFSTFEEIYRRLDEQVK